MKKKYLLIALLCSVTSVSLAQLNVAPNQTAAQMVDMLVGAGVTYTNPQLTCPQNGSGTFSNGVTTSILLDSGVVLTSGRFNTQGANFGVNAPGSSFASNNTNTTGGDADLANAASGQFYDLCKLEFDFVPIGDTIQFKYRFGSEEYPQYNCSNFNDIFAFFIDGPGYPVPTNIALVPGTNIPVAINSINGGQNLGPACTNMGPGSPFTALYVNNTASPDIVYNGLTTILTAKTNVTPCSTYHMKFAIADVFDHIYDSGVFLEAGSFQSGAATVSGTTSSNSLSSVPTSIEGCTSGSVTIKRPTAAPYNQLVQLYFGGTATNGVDVVTIPNVINIPANDSQVVINVAAIQDNFIEGNETFTIYMSGNNCSPAISDSVEFIIQEQPNYTVSLDDTICLGDTKILNATPNPANGNITFNWTPLGSTAPIAGTSVTTSPTVNTSYTVTAVYPGCPDKDSVIDITVEPTPTLSTTVTPITCFGDNNGSITATGNVTYSPIQISLSPSAQSQNISPATFSNLSPANYTVTVTSAVGCTVTSLIPIAQPPVMSWTSAIGSSIPCNVTNIGTINVTAAGGNPTINYSINPSASTNTTGSFSALGPANYTVTATDANNCSITTVVAVTQQTPMFWQAPTVVDIDCFGNNNGSIAIIATGGVGAINYNLQPPNTTNVTGSFINLGPAVYTVSATDANNCTLTSAITINEPAALVWNTQTVNNILCFGANDGSVSFSTTGGTGTINYTLQPSNISNNTGSFSSLNPGNYTITATDSNNCFITSAFSITQPPQFQITNVSMTNPTCVPGNDGSITVTATGGVPNYQYSIGGANQAANNFTSLGAGNYVVVVTDANNCTITSAVAISSPNAPTINSTAVTNNNCFGGNAAAISVAANGGVSPLSYNLQAGNVTNTSGTYTNLLAGSYTVTVTDAIGCTNTSTVNIVDPPQLLWDASTSTDVLCFGENSGTISASTTGGTGQINYSLQPNNISNTTGSFTNLLASNYTVVASDANGCIITTTFSIANPPQLVWANTSAANIICNGANDGTISVAATGGTGQINYNLQPTNTVNSSGNFSNLAAASYTVTATDGNNCTVTTTFNITEPAAININTITSTIPSCVPGSDASITIIASGGTPGLLYNIGGGNQASNIFNNLTDGTYTITVTDANNCTLTSIHAVSPASIPTWTNTVSNNVLCNGDNTGSINATATGLGVVNYNLQPLNITNSTGTFNNLLAGNYIITATDAAGCDTSFSFVITEPSLLQWVSNFSSDVNCFGGNDGVISTFANGGASTITYSLLPGNVNNTTGTFNSLSQGSYTVTATDANNCSITTTFNIAEPSLLQITNVASTVPTCVPGNDAEITINVQGGTPIYLYNNGGLNLTNNVITNVSAGAYTITVTDANNCTVTSNINISVPNSPQWTSVAATAISCNGGADGTIASSANGGTGIISYTLQPGSVINATGSYNNLSAGIYTVDATDALGCSVTSIVNITDPAPITFSSPTLVNISCNGLSDGSITQIATGGTGAITYNMQPGNVTSNMGVFPNLSAGTYTIVATDANNCTESIQLLLNEPSLLTWDVASSNDILCAGGTDGSISINATGGTALYSYNLQPSNTTNSSGSFNNLLANIYTVTATDANNCTITSSVTIAEPAAIISSYTSANVSCFGEADGTVTITSNGGVNPYAFLLQPNNISNNTGAFTNLLAGVYSVIITDSNSCADTITNVTVIEPPQIQFTNITTTDVKCYGGSDGEISLIGLGGNSQNLTYTIVPNIGTQPTPGNFNNLTAGTYTIYAQDSLTCSDSTVLTIGQNPPILITGVAYTSPRCFGEKNGTMTINSMGGIGNLSYQLNTSIPSTTGVFGNLGGGNYIITVTDDLGCTVDSFVTLTEPLLLQIETDIQNVTCQTSADGIILANGIGGNGTYTYYLRPGISLNRTGAFGSLAIGTYTISVRDTLGCQADTIAFVGLPSNPLEVVMSKKNLGCYGYGNEGWAEAVTYGGHPPYSYLWSTTPAQTESKASNLYFGYYQVLVTDSKGCQIKDSVYVEPGPCCDVVFFPNAFSPNGDGQNDRFRMLTSAGVELKQLEVYNRWGQRVWSTTDYTQSWDGTFQGEDAPLATYYYVFSYKCLTDGRDYIKKGDVVLVR